MLPVHETEVAPILPLMLITDEIFRAFLYCETKAYLKFSGDVGPQCEFVEWEQRYFDNFKQKCLAQLRANFGENECLVGTASLQTPGGSKCRLIVDCVLQSQGLQSYVHALERSPTSVNRHHDSFIPIRCVPSKKITKHEKLLLAFDALLLSTSLGEMPLFGKIIHGSELRIVKVKLASLMETARAAVSKIATQQASTMPPQLILNKHCTECEFQPRCRQVAIEKDELTLLLRMSEKERKQHHNKGIFTVTQLSYTFRPRRRPKRSASKPPKYSHSLKALAIREDKIHIVGRPELNTKGKPVFLDIEGIPDQDYYYLIGLRVKSGDSYVQHSLWADTKSEEKQIWTSFLHTLYEVEDPQLIHYGSYEVAFLKKMKERYPETVVDSTFIDQLITDSMNLLSVIYAQVYFPTYSNGLKEIAQYLGFQWTDNASSGLNALMWRSKWESSRDPILKQKLLTYNDEDCEALERVTTAVIQLCKNQIDLSTSADNNVVRADTLTQEWPYLFKRNNFTTPELEYINRAAY